MIPDTSHRSVIAFGFKNGIDWTVRHATDRKTLTLTTESGRAHNIDRATYRDAIFVFADTVEAFYAAAKPKELPKDKAERDGYARLWKEWARLRGRES